MARRISLANGLLAATPKRRRLCSPARAALCAMLGFVTLLFSLIAWAEDRELAKSRLLDVAAHHWSSTYLEHVKANRSVFIDASEPKARVIKSPQPDVQDVYRHANRPAVIVVRGSMPSLDDLPIDSPLRTTWIESLEYMAEESRRLFHALFEEDLLSDIIGIPGTGVSDAEEAIDLQTYLDCMTSEGSWVYDPTGQLSRVELDGNGYTVHKQNALYASCDKTYYKSPHRVPLTSDGPANVNSEADSWSVRESLKWRWRAHASCKDKIPHHVNATSLHLSRKDFCRYLQNKYIMIIGDSPTGYLTHDLLLDWTTEKPATCYGDTYCKEHMICRGNLDPVVLKADARESDAWGHEDHVGPELLPPPILTQQTHLSKRDDSIFERARRALIPEDDTSAHGAPLPIAPDLTTQEGAMLRYRRSDSMLLHGGVTYKGHDAHYVNPATGIREVNLYTLADARRSDLVIMSKSPLPVPEETGHQRHLAALIDDDDVAGEAKVLQIIKAAVNITMDVWLPDILRSLHTLKSVPSDQLVIYRGGWRMQPGCSDPSESVETPAELADPFDWQRWWKSPGDGPPPFDLAPSLKTLFFPALAPEQLPDDTTPVLNRHALFYNVQTVLQNQILRTEILPALGIVFLDTETPMSIWRSGLVGGSTLQRSYLVDQTQSSGTSAMRKPQARNCLQPCLPSAGLALEDALIGALSRLFEWGYSGEHSDLFLDEAYIPIRQRSKEH
ncbi:uncharacterized protein L969DRAFT_16971 [Mixia osmundae IAM 14324]|uniref:Uncharacterized protein n=1 Tax=Mixia osmundae (strain CBS 9802 / IAM 14324 / JCM 22182 / KY 12970) TaxID=764103 RepID=G7E2S6_MIXOS|nr:uncharacterized protein L969DRAFT_16971 [Mixia osmundae IAM 14324]KEI40313.1 hypothetical protein L969DRAFT_16971 [Mixia osmundae IAM 14324]GAA97136.1 hypothetical protein E5Q_03811 [Mixia osmundae IAM 14324]